MSQVPETVGAWGDAISLLECRPTGSLYRLVSQVLNLARAYTGTFESTATVSSDKYTLAVATETGGGKALLAIGAPLTMHIAMDAFRSRDSMGSNLS